MEPQTWTAYFLGMIPIIFMILVWLMPVLIAFARLHNHVLDQTAKAIWVFIILVLPVVGPLTYLMLFSKNNNSVKP